MNKTEITAVVVLFAFLLGWGFMQQKNAARLRARQAGAKPEREAAPHGIWTNTADSVSNPPTAFGVNSQTNNPSTGSGAYTVQNKNQQPVPHHTKPEETIVLSNDVLRITVSSRGGVIKNADLLKYPATLDKNGTPVHLDFSDRPALSIDGIPGLSPAFDFSISKPSGSNAVAIAAHTGSGLLFTRTISLKHDGYTIDIRDTLLNPSTQSVSIAKHAVALGPMQIVQSKARARAMMYLGLDFLPAAGGSKVIHWGRKKLPGMFGYKNAPFSCARPDTRNMPASVEGSIGTPITWLCVKNKFFAQILLPDRESIDGTVYAERDTNTLHLAVNKVSGALVFAPLSIAPQSSMERHFNYYVGPKKYALLKKMGQHQSNIMGFGWFSWLCKPLLLSLNAIHAVIPNYGIAIILLTAIVRILFWPVTHKSTESMKKMQKIQPLVNEVREKYKDNPQKMNQEVMELYKRYKVNPMGGCLPMLVQIPVFIALYTVLRSAVELRYAGFLWISDLSEPEGLFAGMIPVVGSLNILPLFMTATMIWQQHLTPSAGDPQQRKMMMFMPIIMLFIFYPMPSALVLYWSTSQCLAIVQLLIQRKRSGNDDDIPLPPATRNVTRIPQQSRKKSRKKRR